MNIKQILGSIFLFACVFSTAVAQNSVAERLYLAFDVSAAGAPYANFTTKTFAMRSCSLQVGVRFKQHFAVFLKETADLNMLNMADSKNYDETFSLGAGASYSFPVSKFFSIESALTCSSTVIKSALNYLTPKLELRFCGRIPGASSVFIGIGLQYIHPYSKGSIPDMWLSYLSLGFKLF